jgi:hypothetical protein
MGSDSAETQSLKRRLEVFHPDDFLSRYIDSSQERYMVRQMDPSESED